MHHLTPIRKAKDGRKEGREGGREGGRKEGREGGRKEGREGGRKEGKKRKRKLKCKQLLWKMRKKEVKQLVSVTQWPVFRSLRGHSQGKKEGQ